jgi:hypothetical protein
MQSARYNVPAFILALIAGLLAPSVQAQENTNKFAVGRDAKVKNKVLIEVNYPVHFNYKKRDDILTMRSKEVAKHPELLHGTYTPYNPIWGAIEDGKPWWGTAGACVFDSGRRSMEGPAEESRFVMNPFLFVGANPGSTGIWNQAQFTQKQINDPAFPYFWQPESLEIDPQRAVGKVSYNITGYQSKILATGMLRGPAYINRFSLVAYNARDFGYKFIYFNQEKSIHVSNDHPTDEAVSIKQFIHCGGTCGCPGTCCNNMSPFTAEIDRLRLTKLPARAVVYLWREEPEKIDKNPDMVFLLEFR